MSDAVMWCEGKARRFPWALAAATVVTYARHMCAQSIPWVDNAPTAGVRQYTSRAESMLNQLHQEVVELDNTVRRLHVEAGDGLAAGELIDDFELLSRYVSRVSTDYDELEIGLIYRTARRLKSRAAALRAEFIERSQW